MKEQDYIIATNKAKISIALAVLRDVLASNNGEYGITESELSQITKQLSDAEQKLLKLIAAEE